MPSPNRRRLIRALIPQKVDGKKFLYLLGLEDGLVKVGVTANPYNRLRGYEYSLNERVSWMHFFAPVPAECGMWVEDTAKGRLSFVGKVARGNETFSGIDKDAAIATVRAAIGWHIANRFEVARQGAARSSAEKKWSEFKRQCVTS